MENKKASPNKRIKLIVSNPLTPKEAEDRIKKLSNYLSRIWTKPPWYQVTIHVIPNTIWRSRRRARCRHPLHLPTFHHGYARSKSYIEWYRHRRMGLMMLSVIYNLSQQIKLPTKAINSTFVGDSWVLVYLRLCYGLHSQLLLRSVSYAGEDSLYCFGCCVAAVIIADFYTSITD